MDRVAPSLSRRNLLLGLAGVTVAGVVATARLIPGAQEGTRRLLAGNRFTRRFLSLADAGQAEWAAQVGSVFTVDGAASTEAGRSRQVGFAADGGYRLRLAGVQPLTSVGERPPEVARDRAFVAVFEVLGGRQMPADLIYTLRHGQYGPLPVFFSPSGNAAILHAVFN